MSNDHDQSKGSEIDPGQKLKGHSYDGIDELDNSLPKWWINSFYLSIVFALLYVFYYGSDLGPSIQREYDVSKRDFEYSQLAQKGAAKTVSEDELRAFLKDSDKVKAGMAVFQSRCIACHGVHGQGGIGPNLTDDYWIHGGKMTEILNTVTNGVLDKGMPPWGQMLKQDEIISVVTFVKTLRGTNPPGAKAPQGELVKE